MNNRFLIGGLIGGVAFFLLGYLIYAIALGTMLEENMMAGLNRPMEEFQWLFLILANLALGFLLSYVLTKSNTAGFGGGATVGAIVGLLVGMSIDFFLYGATNYFSTLTGVFVDFVAFTIMCAIVGGIIGAYLGSGNKPVVRV